MFELSYYGVSAFFIKTAGGQGIMIDPYLEESPVPWEDMPHADYVVVTHGASDHLGRAVEMAQRFDSLLIGPPEVAEYARLSGVSPDRVKSMVPGAVRGFDGLQLKAVWASHVSIIKLAQSGYITGVPLGYILTLDDGTKLYHMGDTAIYSDLKMVGELYKPEILLVPIGMFHGAVTEMEPWEAALAAQWINPRLVIPMHYDAEEQREYPELLKKHLEDAGAKIPVMVMQPGQTKQIR